MSADASSYFYLRDNPQCSASPNNSMNLFTQQPNQPYMSPMLTQQQKRFQQAPLAGFAQ